MSEPTAPIDATAVAATPDTGPRRDIILARKGVIARLRALRRAIAMVLVTTGICVAWPLGAACLFWSSERRHAWRRVLMRRWCKLGCAALGVRVTVRGTLPKDAQYLVANHLGYIDILVLGAQANAAFVSRADVEHWPVIGWLAKQFDTVFLERSKKRDLPTVNAGLKERLERGEIIVMFPEGTSSSGEGLLPFRSPLLGPPAEHGSAVAAACIRYATGTGDPAPMNCVAWWGDMDFAAHASAMLSVTRIDATIDFAPTARRDSDRKQLAATLQQDVQALFDSPL
jgi:1-acyl-sn-glycerol-3-phosphate acyltransferase